MKAYFYNDRLISDEGKQISVEKTDGVVFRLVKSILYLFAYLPSSYRLRIAGNEYYIGQTWTGGTYLRKSGFKLANITGHQLEDVKVKTSKIPLVHTRFIERKGMAGDMDVQTEGKTICKIKVFYAVVRHRVELEYVEDADNDILAISIAVALRLMFC